MTMAKTPAHLPSVGVFRRLMSRRATSSLPSRVEPNEPATLETRTSEAVVATPGQAIATGSDGANELNNEPPKTANDRITSDGRPSRANSRDQQSPPFPAAPENDPSQHSILTRLRKVIVTFGQFIGPGFMIAVAYSRSHLPISTMPSHILISEGS